MEAKELAKNKKAYFDYEVLEKYETGIVLKGAEVKSIKAGHIQLKGSYAEAAAGRVYMKNAHVSPYKYSADKSLDPMRPRQLLLKKKEIACLAGLEVQKGLTLIPLAAYLKKGMIKILLGVCRGKKAHDKRQVLKKRAVDKEISQSLKKFSR